MASPETFDTRVVASRSLSPGVRELVLERADGRSFLFEPGQWVNLVLPLPGNEIKRAYSIASPPRDSSRFEIAVTRVTGGPASVYLHELQEGAILRAIGPHGLYTRASGDPSPSLFVATGTGVTPLRSMIHAALAVRSEVPMWLLFGARHEEDILYKEEFEKLTSSSGKLRFEITLSRPRPDWKGRRGYVQDHVPELYRELTAKVNPLHPHVYVCGLERMVKSVRELGRGSLGIDRKHVHTERYD